MRPYFPADLLRIAVVACCFGGLVAAQAPPQSPAAANPAAPESSSAKTNAARHSNDFLVRGTVFTQEGLSLAGAELQIRRASDKKPHWQAITNSRGDFAMRVKMGSDYEVTVRAKGYQDQSVAVDAKSGERYKDLVFRMQHLGGKKP